MQALYKKATKDNHDYETEGVFYFYKTCAIEDIDNYVDDGWLLEFSDLKENDDEKQMQGQGQETSQEVKPKRGRKPKNGMD